SMSIGLDLGTSAVKALRLDDDGRVVAAVHRPLRVRRARGGRVEQDPGEILESARQALEAIGGTPGEHLGIATQRSTVLFWDRDSGRPLTPAYSWQDRRGEAICERARRRHARSAPSNASDLADWIHARTGLRLSPHYAASKLAWALENEAGLRRKVATGRALWGTLGAYVVWHLGGRSIHAIDHANAQRTLLFDLRTRGWSPSLFRLFGLEALLEAPALPDLVPTIASFDIEVKLGSGRLHLRAITGDQQAAMVALGVRSEGDTVINYGTGAFVLEFTGRERKDVRGLLTTLLASWREGSAPRSRDVYALEGSVNAAAAAIEWAQKRLRIRVPMSRIDAWLRGTRSPRSRKPGVWFLPAVAGLGAPHWDASASPAFFGDARGASPRDLLRAVVASIAFRCTEILRAASWRSGRPTGERPIFVAGGLARCRTLLQAQADLLQRELLVSDEADATAVGAARMALGGRRGVLPRVRPVRGRIIRPRISRDEAEGRFAEWSEAVYGGRVGSDRKNR
ncbi:MAG: hypothetical protein HY049_06980, partial [Acidobacteria bacterium]|nr:hypothetical protein [Acidobacteriota bacterium]